MNAVRRLFLGFLGLIYLAAFLSLWPQVPGLFGSQGILPAQPFLNAVHERLGAAAFFAFPGVFWAGASDLLLKFWCGAGIALSALLVLGFAPAPVLALLWAVYLSFFSIGRDFLSFQWDVLLLETGFLAIFLAPLGWGKGLWERSEPSKVVVWLFRWLLFRLMFSSGAMKWISGDVTWRTLTALNFHYETQPLPPWTAWYLHHLPERFHQASVAGMFAIELAAPFLIFAPKRARIAAFGALVSLQAFILASGNYCFFNWLTIALCLLLLDDRALVFGRGQKPAAAAPAASHRSSAWPRRVIAPVAAFLIMLSTFHFLFGLRLAIPWPKQVLHAARFTAPWCFAGSYGLFAVMTTTRPEIIVEGSEDGIRWKAYEFKYKPGDLDRTPRFVAPHQPRLDWQMWFAALGHARQNPWFIAFCKRLLEGSPDVLSLLRTNPFPNRPPRYVRALSYPYRFTSPEERRRTGRFWRREPEAKLYLPAVSL